MVLKLELNQFLIFMIKLNILFIIEISNLKFESLGMKLINIHRILSFKQKNWLKVFTDFNTEK